MTIENELSATDLIARADRMLGEGRVEQAIALYRDALAMAPASPDAWFNLAWAQRADRRFEDALASYANAIAHGIDRPEEARLNRAVIFSEFLFQPERAIEELRAALQLDPQSIPALLNLANIHEDLGAVDEARAGYRRVLALDPGNGRAHARLGTIDVFSGDAAAAVTKLQQALSIAPVEARAEILFALGTALDEVADYAGAFQAFEAANWQAHYMAPAVYDAAGQAEVVDRIVRAYPAAHQADGQGDTRPIFICGMFRSGSTVLEQILGRHSAITAAGELDIIPAFARRLQPYPEAAAALSAEDIAALREEYLRGLPGEGLTTDKRCDNFLHIGLIKTLFPDARIIHTMRQPLDNLLSVYFLHFGHEIVYGHALAEAAHFYIQYRRMMDHWRTLYGPDIHDVDYDALVASPRETVGRLLQFLDLPWEDACLAASTTGAIRTASVWQTRKPLHDRSSGRWRHYEDQLATVRRMLADAQL